MDSTEIIEKIRAEIEQMLHSIENCPFISGELGAREKEMGEVMAYKNILSFLSDLEKECSIPNDLEEAAKLHRSTAIYGGDINLAMEDSFKKGAEWQREKSEKPINVLSDDLEKAAREYAMDDFYNGYSSGSIIEDTMKNFKSGAQWGAEHLKK